MDQSAPETVELKKPEKKSMTPERLEQLQKARDLALLARKEKADLKTKEKELKKLEQETKKKEIENRMMELNSEPPAKKKKEKKVVYVDPSSSSESSEEEIEYVKRPKQKKVIQEMSKADYHDQIHRLRKEQMMNMMFGGRAY